MSLIIDMTNIASNLGALELEILQNKTVLSNTELKAIDPESKSAVDKQIMIFAQKTESYVTMKADVDFQVATLASYQRMYSLFNSICSRIDFNIENNPLFAEFEAQVHEVAESISKLKF